MDDKIKYALAGVALIALFAIPFLLNPGSQFGGADNAGSAAVKAQQPGYKPWFAPIWTPPPEIESMLFALQAAIGALIIGYFIGYEKARRDFGKKEKGEEKHRSGSRSRPS